MQYLNESLIRNSFLQLRQKQAGGKKGLERTSALICFLALDALLKRTGIHPPLNLDPEDSNGKANRDRLTREFVRILHIKTIESVPYHVLDLGEIAIGGTSPEKRFSSNFLTVSLKAATTRSEANGYPSRPPYPLIFLGPKATGLIWGMDRHPSWQANLPIFLRDRNTKTPFHDLACFLLRQRGIETSSTSLEEFLMSGLSEMFTDELCAFWKTQLTLEKVYMSKIELLFQDSPPSPFADHSWLGNNEQADPTIVLRLRIDYLEGLLKLHHITFD